MEQQKNLTANFGGEFDIVAKKQLDKQFQLIFTLNKLEGIEKL
jgi:hypothetical protein